MSMSKIALVNYDGVNELLSKQRERMHVYLPSHQYRRPLL